MIRLYLELYNTRYGDDLTVTVLSGHDEFLKARRYASCIHIIEGKKFTYYMIYLTNYFTRSQAIEHAKLWHEKREIVRISLRPENNE